MPDTPTKRYCEAHQLLNCSLCFRREPEPCHCDAYSFPHKAGGGLCYYREGEYARLSNSFAADSSKSSER